MLASEWDSLSLIKSRRKLFNSHLFVMKWAVIPKKDMLFGEVQPSIVKEILLVIFYKKLKYN
jgi:hypothetical protein